MSTSDFPLIPVEEYKEILASLPESKSSDDFQNLYLDKGEQALEEPSHRTVSKKNDTKLSWGVVRERQIKMLLGAYKKKKSPAHRNALLKWAYRPEELEEESSVDESKKEDQSEKKPKKKTDNMNELLEAIAKGIARIETVLSNLQIRKDED